MLASACAGGGTWREIAVTSPDHLIALPLGGYLAVHAVSGLLLLRRRQAPQAVAFLVAALALLTPTYAAGAAAYSAAVHVVNRRRVWLPVAALSVGWLLGARFWALEDPYAGLAAVVVALLLGLYVRARRSLLQALVERAERAEREQQLLAEQARAEERARLAGEMHDLVAHRVSLMVLQAGALRASTEDPDVETAAERLRGDGELALAELRQLVGVLRGGFRAVTPEDPPAPVAGPATTDPIDELVTGAHAAGLSVGLTDRVDWDRVDDAVRRTVHRVVQESLTNVAKHAPGAVTSIELDRVGDRVHVTVQNGPPTERIDRGLAHSGSGTGLFGLRQRVELLAGQLAHEPAGGGYVVRAELPTR